MLPGNAQIKKITPQVKETTPQVKRKKNQTAMTSSKRNSPISIQTKILQICTVPRTAAEIAAYLGLKDRKGIRIRGILPLLHEGWLAMTIPDKPNSRFQKYITIKQNVFYGV